MLESLKANWKTTIMGICVSSLGAFAAIENWDKLSPRDALLALGGCFLYAIKGAMTADAKKGGDGK